MLVELLESLFVQCSFAMRYSSNCGNQKTKKYQKLRLTKRILVLKAEHLLEVCSVAITVRLMEVDLTVR